MNLEEVLSERGLQRKNFLCNTVIYHTSSSDEWKNRLDQEQDYRAIISLLHWGLDEDVRGHFSYEDTLCTYFDYADGYDNPNSFLPPMGLRHESRAKVYLDTDGKYISSQELKQKIALKAFNVLSNKFFKDTRENNSFKKASYQPSWWPSINSERLLNKVIDFFLFSKNIPSGSDLSHTKSAAIDFLYKLATSAWVINFRDNSDRAMDVPKVLIKNRDFFIKILGDLKELDFLEKNWELLSPEDRKTIKYLANHTQDQAGDPIPMDQAFLNGNQMAATCYVIERKVHIKRTGLALVY